MRKHQCFALHWLSCNLHMDFKFLLAMVSSGPDRHILPRLLRKKKIALYVYCFIQAQSGTFWGTLEPLYGADTKVHRRMYNGGCGHPERAWFMCQDEHAFFFSVCGIFLSESMYCFLSPHSLQHSLNHLMMELQPTSFISHSPAHSPNSLIPQWPSTFPTFYQQCLICTTLSPESLWLCHSTQGPCPLPANCQSLKGKERVCLIQPGLVPNWS